MFQIVCCRYTGKSIKYAPASPEQQEHSRRSGNIVRVKLDDDEKLQNIRANSSWTSITIIIANVVAIRKRAGPHIRTLLAGWQERLDNWKRPSTFFNHLTHIRRFKLPTKPPTCRLHTHTHTQTFYPSTSKYTCTYPANFCNPPSLPPTPLSVYCGRGGVRVCVHMTLLRTGWMKRVHTALNNICFLERLVPPTHQWLHKMAIESSLKDGFLRKLLAKVLMASEYNVFFFFFVYFTCVCCVDYIFMSSCVL